MLTQAGRLGKASLSVAPSRDRMIIIIIVYCGDLDLL